MTSFPAIQVGTAAQAILQAGTRSSLLDRSRNAFAKSLDHDAAGHLSQMMLGGADSCELDDGHVGELIVVGNQGEATW